MNLRNFLCFVLYMVCITATPEETWSKMKRKLHKAKSLRTDRMRKLALLSSDPAEIKYFRKHLLKPILRVRVSDTDNNRLVQEHIKHHMSSFGWHLNEDRFTDSTPKGQKEFTTIIATQNPSASRKLILACHHDSKLFEKFEFVAATDSAVPCAMMLDFARLMNSTLWKEDNNKVQDVTLQFIFFDGEEAFENWSATDSIYGARHLAKKMTATMRQVGREEEVPEIDTIDAMVLLDLIGTRKTQFRNWFQETEKLFQRLQKIELKLIKEGLLEPVDHFSSNTNKYFVGNLMPNRAGIEDDHKPFLEKDVPIVHLISYPFPDEWHRASDNENALDYPTINNINKILRVFAAEYLHLSP